MISAPWFTAQDVLIVCADGNIAENAWIVLRTEQEFFLARVVNEKFIHPATLQNYPDFLTPPVVQSSAKPAIFPPEGPKMREPP